MHLKRVEFHRFRCFKKIEIDLHPRLTVLVAENGGGKTAVLDGIALGLSPILRFLSTADQRINGPGFADKDFHLMPFYDTLSLFDEESVYRMERLITSDYSQVLIETTDGLTWDNWRAAKKGAQPEKKIGQTNLSPYALRILETKPDVKPEPLPVFAYYGARRGWIEIPERLRPTTINYSHPNSALVGALDALSDFKEMLKWFDYEEANELRANKGRTHAEYVMSPILKEVRYALATILHDKFKNPHFNDKHKFVVERSGANDLLQISQLSQGYQSMLALGMDFARRLALANQYFAKEQVPRFAKAIMLVDEIDLHLHPSWQQRVLNDLMEAFPETQFIVTTHSPQVLTAIRKENIRVLTCDDKGDWKAEIPTCNPYAHASMLPLEAIMNTDAYPPCLLTNDFREYQRLVGDDQHDSFRALELRAKLEKEWGKQDIEIQLMDIAIRKNETLRKLRKRDN